MENGRPIQNVDDCDDPVLSAAFKHFCSHLVSLDGRYQPLDDTGLPNGPMKPFAYAGTILSVYGCWFFVTAGHTLRTIDKYLTYPKARIDSWCLRDHFGADPVSKYPVPFNYGDASSFPIRDDELGLDFGLVSLNSNQQQLLAANKIVPICESNWINQLEREFDWHIMLGLPEQFVDTSHVCPTMIYVTQLNDLPPGVESTVCPRFVGQLDSRTTIDIKGMSGGPIFGFSRDHPGRYWVVAIQSGWFPESKIVFGCPVPVFAQIVKDAYESESDK